MRSSYKAWDEWSVTSGAKRAYFVVMTPVTAIVSAVLFVTGTWLPAVILLAVALLGVRVLTRKRI
jgi:hypothetical protein